MALRLDLREHVVLGYVGHGQSQQQDIDLIDVLFVNHGPGVDIGCFYHRVSGAFQDFVEQNANQSLVADQIGSQ